MCFSYPIGKPHLWFSCFLFSFYYTPLLLSSIFSASAVLPFQLLLISHYPPSFQCQHQSSFASSPPLALPVPPFQFLPYSSSCFYSSTYLILSSLPAFVSASLDNPREFLARSASSAAPFFLASCLSHITAFSLGALL